MSMKLYLLGFQAKGLESHSFHKDRIFLNRLQELYADFTSNIKEYAPESIVFKIQSEILTTTKRNQTFRFAKVEVLDSSRSERTIEVIDIFVKQLDKNLRFVTVPNAEHFSYEVKKQNDDGQKKTKALKAIEQTLFDMGGEVAVSSSEPEGPDSISLALQDWIKASKYFILKKGLLEDLENKLPDMPVNEINHIKTGVEVSVIDQPFTNSCFNSSDDYHVPGLSPFGLYQSAISRILDSITIAVSKKEI